MKGINRKPESSKPEITLYLEKINQEMIRTGSTTLDCDLYGSWTKSCCILDFSITKPEDLVVNPLRGLMIRGEEGGALMWNPRTSAVYKLNEAAYHAILDLESGFNEYELARRNDLELDDVRAMMKELRSIAS